VARKVKLRALIPEEYAERRDLAQRRCVDEEDQRQDEQQQGQQPMPLRFIALAFIAPPN